jgi:hypothetical protein
MVSFGSVALRTPVVLDIRLTFRRRANSKFDGQKAVLFVKATGRYIFLMRMQLKSIWRKRHRMRDQCRTNPHPLNSRQHVEPVNVAAFNCEEAHHLTVLFRDPNVAAEKQVLMEEHSVLVKCASLL